MRSKHRKTLADIFHNPIPSNITWEDVESLFDALDAELTEGRGSRVRVYLNGIRAVFHKPHPEKEVNRGMVRSIRRFLIEANVDPSDHEQANEEKE